MVYFSANAIAPAMTAGGPQSYQNPYYKTQCGCGSGRNQVTMAPQGVREGFNTRERLQGELPVVGSGVVVNGNGNGAGAAPVVVGAGAPMCTLTATAPPAGCCHPAPLHCDCCNGSGYFRASEAYGS